MNVEPDFRRLICKISLDVACLLAVSIPIYIYYLFGKPYERGFFCNDDSLRHPYLDSTVPSWVLYVVGLGLPTVFILFTEYVLHKKNKEFKQNIRIMSFQLPSWIWESYKHVGVFGFGAACSQLTTDIAKYTIGRLRPHFFDVCKPDIDCMNPKYKYMYIEKFNCQEKNEKLLKDMRLSFPSGHSSFSAYCMLFLVIYVQYKITWRGSELFKHILQYGCIAMAFYTALTRISDYKHHWSDVLAGSLQGALVAILIIVYVSNLLEKPGKLKAQTITDSLNRENIRMENNFSMS